MAKKQQKKTGGDKNLLLYVGAFGALLLILVYVFVYQKLNTEAEAINTSNVILAQRVSQLKEYYDHREEYLADTRLLEQMLDELLAVYPADAREEDAIMLAVEMQRESGAAFLTVNMQKGDVIHEVPAETVSAAGNEKYSQAIQFRNLDAAYVNEVSYAGLKRMIQTIYDSSNRIGIQNVVYSKGDAENPNLSGHIDLGFYSVQGTGKEYAAPDMIPYIAGTDNIFGKVTVSGEEADDSSEESAENGEGAEEGGEAGAVRSEQ